MIWPVPNLDRERQSWPEIVLGVATVRLEAGGESDQGKLGVAHVICTRMRQKRLSLRQIVLAPWQFSCWPPASTEAWIRAQLTGTDAVTWESCWWAMTGAYFDLLPDPTGGADHYLNPKATMEARATHDLPDWYDPERVTWREGRHEFLRLA